MAACCSLVATNINSSKWQQLQFIHNKHEQQHMAACCSSDVVDPHAVLCNAYATTF